MIVWCFTDGKAGHENQTLGLLAALRERVSVEDHRIHISECRKGMMACLRGRDPFGKELPDPDLILGAGHGTHLSLLNARRIRGGKTVVLMKPTLPTAWFDLCLIPQHDRPRHAENILVTQGVLNRVRGCVEKDGNAGLFLVGGPSQHVDWSSDAVRRQIETVLERSPGMDWQLATSRRTPADFPDQLARPAGSRLVVVPFETTDPGWLPAQLATAGTVWVTEDSVSMVYEALTSGAAVGLLQVPFRRHNDRLAAGLRDLQSKGLVTTFTAWSGDAGLRSPQPPFNEAARCADWIVTHWLADRAVSSETAG